MIHALRMRAAALALAAAIVFVPRPATAQGG